MDENCCSDIRTEAEKSPDGALSRRAGLLGKWLRVAFWLIVPSTLAGLMGNDSLTGVSPGLHTAGQVLSAVCSAAYAVVLFIISPEDKGYRTAGICALLSAAANLAAVSLSSPAGYRAASWSLVIALAGAVAGLVGQYNEFGAHSRMLEDLDDALSAKWTSLWKYYIGFSLALFGGVILLFIAPFLGNLLLLVSAVGIAVVGIVKLVRLYRTAKVFRSLPAQDAPRDAG